MGIWSALTPTQSNHSFQRTLNQMGNRVAEVSPFFHAPREDSDQTEHSAFCQTQLVQKFQNMKKKFQHYVDVRGEAVPTPRVFFKFHDFSMHGTIFSDFPGFP